MATLVLPRLQQRVATLDARALLLPALDETILRNKRRKQRVVWIGSLATAIVRNYISRPRYRARPIIKPLGFIGLRKAIDAFRGSRIASAAGTREEVATLENNKDYHHRGGEGDRSSARLTRRGHSSWEVDSNEIFLYRF